MKSRILKYHSKSFFILFCSFFIATLTYANNPYVIENVGMLKTSKLYDIENYQENYNIANSVKDSFLEKSDKAINLSKSVDKAVYNAFCNLVDKVWDQDTVNIKINVELKKLRDAGFGKYLLDLSDTFGYDDVKAITDKIHEQGKADFRHAMIIKELLDAVEKTFSHFKIIGVEGYKNHTKLVKLGLHKLKAPIAEATRMATATNNLSESAIRMEVTPLDLTELNNRGKEKLDELLLQQAHFINLKILADMYIMQFAGRDFIEIKNKEGKSLECIPIKITSKNLVFISQQSVIYVVPLNIIDKAYIGKIKDYIKDNKI